MNTTTNAAMNATAAAPAARTRSPKRLADALGRLLYRLAVLLSAAWVGLAFWYRLPFAEAWRIAAIVAWGLAVLVFLGLDLLRPAWRWRIGYGLCLVAVGLWWSTIRPTGTGDWGLDVAHQATGALDGDRVTIANVRDFDWRSETEFTPLWETRSYDLDRIRSVDLFLSYWSSPAIAHTLVSFGFDDGRHLVFSAETRKRKDQEYSSVSGFFKEFELVLVAANERDIIRLRTNIRGEEVYRYPIPMSPEARRELFLSYVALANRLAAKPQFYNTATTNCTTVVYRMVKAIDPGLPRDYRILLSGYLPGYIYDHETPPPPVPLETFMRRAAVSALGKAAGDAPDFSARIRPDVPSTAASE